MKKTLILVLCCVSILYSQPNQEDRNFSVFLSGGTSLNSSGNYFFYKETEDVLFKPGIYGNIGIEYGGIDLLDLTQLFISISAGYSKVSTGEQLLNDTPTYANLIIETVPILIWAKLETKSRLSPFVELGIGGSWLNFDESYSMDFLKGTSFNYWALSLGFGAGVSYRISNIFDISIVIQNITSEKEHIEKNDRNHKSGIRLRGVIIPICMKLKIKLW